MIKFIIDTYHKSKSAAILSNILEKSNNELFLDITNIPMLSNSLITEVWDSKGYLFDGSRNYRPHHLIMACISINEQIKKETIESNMFSLYMYSLGNILAMLDNNHRAYRFSKADYVILNKISEVFNAKQQEFENNNKELISELDELITNKK